AGELAALAERTRDDVLLVRALAERLRERARNQPSYDVAAGDATLARAVEITRRVGDPVGLRYDIAESGFAHAWRAGRRAAARQAIVDQEKLSREAGFPYQALW